MEDFAAIHVPRAEEREPNFQLVPSLTMSDDANSSLEKGHDHHNHTLDRQPRGSNEENQAEESRVVSKVRGGNAVPYEWDTLLEPLLCPAANPKRSPNNEIVLSEHVDNFHEGETNPLQEKRTTPVNGTASPSRRRRPTSRSKKDPRHSQSSTRSVLSKATRDLIFNESEDSSDGDTRESLGRVASIEEVVPSNGSALQMLRGNYSGSFDDDQDQRRPMKTFKVKKTIKEKQGTQGMNSSPKEKGQAISHSAQNGWGKLPMADEQEKAPHELPEEKSILIPQNPFALANLFANSCSPSQGTPDDKEETNNILMARPPNNFAFLAEVFQCGNHYEDDVISPRNNQFVLDTFDRTLCGIPAKMANITLDDFLDEELEQFEDDVAWPRSSPVARSRPKKETITPILKSKRDASSQLYGVLKEHMRNGGTKFGDSTTHEMGESIDDDPQVQRELQRLCKLLEAKLDGHEIGATDESDVEDYYDDDSDSDYDEEEDRLFENWMRSGPITDLFGIGCNERNGPWHELTYNERGSFGRSYHGNERFYPTDDDDYSDGFEEDYYSDAESTESNLTIVKASDYK